jgi:hypothetical protein
VIVSTTHLAQALILLQERAKAAGWVPDGVSLPPGCNTLCELLGTMWFAGEALARVADDGAVAVKLREVLGEEFNGAAEVAPEAA